MKRFSTVGLAIFLALLSVYSGRAQAPQASGLDKERGRDMLNIIKSDLKKNYYDASFHGMDVDAEACGERGGIGQAG